MPERRRKFTPEYREEAVKAVIETSRPIAQVARELGIVEGTLGNWVDAYRRDHAGEEPPLACVGAGPAAGAGARKSGSCG